MILVAMSTKALHHDSIARRLRLLLCNVGVHDWGKWQKVEVHHMGEMPWDTWQHLCHSNQRICLCCGHKSRRRKHCQGPYKSLPNQEE